ncbi:MAG: hypothetical protein V4702_02885 [Patescibacteria group bacterium]
MSLFQEVPPRHAVVDGLVEPYFGSLDPSTFLLQSAKDVTADLATACLLGDGGLDPFEPKFQEHALAYLGSDLPETLAEARIRYIRATLVFGRSSPALKSLVTQVCQVAYEALEVPSRV